MPLKTALPENDYLILKDQNRADHRQIALHLAHHIQHIVDYDWRRLHRLNVFRQVAHHGDRNDHHY